jgi:FOG: TPR repeat, SEL1 subfamily
MKKDKATDAYDAGDYETALKEFRKLAEKGDAEAQNNLGVMYAKGEGVTQNNKEAAKWYHLAAEQGHASAQYNLGVMCYTTKYHGTTIRDKKEGAKWYHLAAEQGHAGAQYRLGLMYRDEFGDDESTLKLLRLAAKQG